MSYALRKLNAETPENLSASISIPAPTEDSGDYHYIHEFVAERLGPGSIYVIGKDNGNRIFFEPSGNLIIRNSGLDDLVLISNSSYSINDRLHVIIETIFNGSEQKRLVTINGILEGDFSINSTRAASTDFNQVFIWSDSGNSQCQIEEIKFTDNNNSTSNRHYLNTSGTGTVWPDVSGNGVNATINNPDPNDGHWVLYGDPPRLITLNSTPVYGETISGSYSNFSGTPTGPLQADDGTRQADISISVDSNNETFTGTFPALPAAGQSLPAGSLPFPGSIDVTLPDPGE